MLPLSIAHMKALYSSDIINNTKEVLLPFVSFLYIRKEDEDKSNV
jgi:hypothetical protein